MRPLLGAIVLGALLAPRTGPAASPRVDAVVDTLSAVLDVEKRSLAEDLDELERVSSRLTRSESVANSARARFVQVVREGGAERGSIESAEDAIVDAEARVRAEQDRTRILAGRIAERTRRIASLREEITRRKAGPRVLDPLTGRWDVQINPGPRRGVFRLVLDGTLLSGDYTLDGGFRGSFRGTFVGDKVTLQRIDSTQGFDATFYGRLIPAQRKIAGSWEATLLAPASGPTAGTWVGTFTPERDDEGEKP